MRGFAPLYPRAAPHASHGRHKPDGVSTVSAAVLAHPIASLHGSERYEYDKTARFVLTYRIGG